MATNSSVNLRITNNPDGFDVAGGTTVRKITVSGGDVSIVGTGANVISMPPLSTTLATLGANQFSDVQKGMQIDNMIVTGMTTGAGATAVNTPYTIVTRDRSGNTAINNVIEGYTTTAMGSGNNGTYLNEMSTYLQFFTAGVANWEIRLPFPVYLTIGQQFLFVNNGTFEARIKSCGTDIVQIMAPGSSLLVTCISNAAVTTTAPWSAVYSLNEFSGYTTTATAAGTTVFTVASTYQQYFTGTNTQTVTLPVTSTLALGRQYKIVNNSTQAVTVNSSGSNAVIVLAGGTSAILTCILISGTTAASWAYWYEGVTVASGKVLSVSNTITLAGTDGTTMTFPSTSATIARTDAANSFTGIQTMGAALREKVSALTPGSTPALDAALGNVFTIAMANDPTTIAVPSNAVDGQKIIIKASTDATPRTLALNTGAGGFRFGADITALTQTAANKTDYIGCVYNGTASFWDVIAYTKGF
jgi:hypothetical protein